MTTPPSIALVSGICLLPDAISALMLRKMTALRRLFGAEAEITGFVYDHNAPSHLFHRVSGVCDLLARPGFQDADLVIFEFGIYYELFNAILALPKRKAKVVCFHNITPESLLVNESQRQAVRRARVQLANARVADRIWSDSEYNRDELIAGGFPRDRLDILHPPLTHDPQKLPLRWQTPPRRLELLYVGRLVPAKGLGDLVQAIALLPPTWWDRIKLRLVGSMRFSDPEFVSALRQSIWSAGLERVVELTGEVDDQQLSTLYRQSDVFVMPSHHEGFCMPIIEALSLGCAVISSDAGNLPQTCGNLARIYPCGKVASLAHALSDFLDGLASSPAEVRLNTRTISASTFYREVSAYLLHFTPTAFDRQMAHLVRRLGFAPGQPLSGLSSQY